MERLREKREIAREAYDMLDWVLFGDGDRPYHGNIVLHVNASEIMKVEPDRNYIRKEWKKLDQDS